jgi:hypothetical protein
MSMKTLFSTVSTMFVLGLLLVQTACYKDNRESMYPSTLVCNTDSITWSKDIKVVVDNACATSGCHSNAAAAGAYDLSNYTGVKTMVDNNRFLAVIESGSMPKGAAPLDKCTINKIRSWIAQGALQN